MAVINPYNYARVEKQETQGIIMNNLSNRVRMSQAKQDAYLEQKILMAKPQELTMMLYEGVVRFIKLAKYYLDKSSVEKTHENAVKAQNIVLELQATLNMDYEVSYNLSKLYDFVLNELIQGNIDKDSKRFDNALEIVQELSDTWREAIEKM